MNREDGIAVTADTKDQIEVKASIGEAPTRPLTATSGTGGRRLRRALRGNLGTAIGVIIFGVVCFFLWEGAFRLGIFSKFIVPSAYETLHRIFTIFDSVFTGGVFLRATLLTLYEIAAGFAIGAVLGIVLGIVIGETAFGRRILMPYVVAFNAMPKVAFAPLLVAALGFGVAPKIALAAIIAFFPVVVNAAAGIESVNENELMLFQAIEATRWQKLWKLKFPTSLPFTFAGLKIAAVLAVIGAVIGDILSGGNGGLGKQITLATVQLQTPVIFAIIVLLSIVGLVVYLVVALAEHYIVHWRQPRWRKK